MHLFFKNFKQIIKYYDLERPHTPGFHRAGYIDVQDILISVIQGWVDSCADL